MRVLAMQIDQLLAHGFELRERRGRAIDPGAAAALRVEHAAQQQRLRIAKIVVRKPPARGRRVAQIELGGNLRALGARAQLARFETVAEQQRQRIEQDRFARARFAGQHGEPGAELGVERLDDGKVANRQRTQHY